MTIQKLRGNEASLLELTLLLGVELCGEPNLSDVERALLLADKVLWQGEIANAE